MTKKGAIQYPETHKHLIDAVTTYPQTVGEIKERLLKILKRKRKAKGTSKDTLTKYLRQMVEEGKIESVTMGKKATTFYYKKDI